MTLHGYHFFVALERARPEPGAIEDQCRGEIGKTRHLALFEGDLPLEVVTQRLHHGPGIHEDAVVINDHVARGSVPEVQGDILGRFHDLPHVRLEPGFLAVVEISGVDRCALGEIRVRALGHRGEEFVSVHSDLIDDLLHLRRVVHRYRGQKPAGLVRGEFFELVGHHRHVGIAALDQLVGREQADHTCAHHGDWRILGQRFALLGLLRQIHHIPRRTRRQRPTTASVSVIVGDELLALGFHAQIRRTVAHRPVAMDSLAEISAIELGRIHLAHYACSRRGR